MVNFTNDINGGIQNVTDFFAGPGEATEAQPWYNDAQLINFPNVSIFFHMQTYKPDMAWDMGLRPYNDANAAAKSQGLSGEQFAWGYVVPKAVTGATQDAAFKWLQEITYEPDSAGWFVQQQGRPSPIKAVNEDQTFYDVNPHWDKVLLSLASDVSVAILPVHARVSDIATQGVQAAMFGDAARGRGARHRRAAGAGRRRRVLGYAGMSVHCVVTRGRNIRAARLRGEVQAPTQASADACGRGGLGTKVPAGARVGGLR